MVSNEKFRVRWRLTKLASKPAAAGNLLGAQSPSGNRGALSKTSKLQQALVSAC